MIKHINCVIIRNIECIPRKYVDQFETFIFEDIAWIDEERTYDSKIFTLKKYYSDEIIDKLNERKVAFCNKHNIENVDMVMIAAYNSRVNETDNMGMDHNAKRCKIVDLKKFKKIDKLDLEELPYCFKLSDLTFKDEGGITVQLKSNNDRKKITPFMITPLLHSKKFFL